MRDIQGSGGHSFRFLLVNMLVMEVTASWAARGTTWRLQNWSKGIGFLVRTAYCICGLRGRGCWVPWVL